MATPSKEILDKYGIDPKKAARDMLNMEKELLLQARPMMILSSSGNGYRPKEKWSQKILYFLRLKKRPPVKKFSDIKVGDTITFRRPYPFKWKRYFSDNKNIEHAVFNKIQFMRYRLQRIN